MASVVDRLHAAKFTVTGNEVSKIIGKATTHEMGAPKRKHLDYLISSTHEPNVSLPECADMLLSRVQDVSWIVSLKAMISLHHIMNDGNEKFMQYMASKANSFEFLSDKSGPLSEDMGSFVKKYGHYLSEKCISYRQLAMDFVRVSSTSMLRSAGVEKLLTNLPVLQSHIDGIINLEIVSSEVCTEINRAAFVMLLRDLISLFKIYNEGIINMLENFFEMEKKNARDSFDLYKKFIVRMGKVETFLKIAEDAGIDEGNVPDLSKAPSCLLSALENHLAQLEKKGTPISSPTANDFKSSPILQPAAEAIVNKSDPFGSNDVDPFGDTFSPVPPQADLLGSDPFGQPAPPPQSAVRSDRDELADLLSGPTPPVVHNQAIFVEQSFNPFTSGQPDQSNLFTLPQSQPVQQNSAFDLLCDGIPDNVQGNGFASFGQPEPVNDFLMPDQPNANPMSTPQNISSLMQDLDLGLKSAAANFTLSNSINKGGTAVGPVRPVSSGPTYNPFVRYPMMQGRQAGTMPSMGMQPQGAMQGQGAMNPQMQGSFTMQGNMGGMQGGMQGMGMQQPMMGMQQPMMGNMQGMNGMQGMRPMNNMMQQQQPRQQSNAFQFSNNNQGGFDPFS